MTLEKSKIENIVESINAKNCKRVAFALVITFILYHELLHLKHGSNSCQWLLSAGRYKGNQEWQPYGCMLHFYSKIDARRCLRYIAFCELNTHFVFIGDTRIKEVYSAFVEQIQINNNQQKEPQKYGSRNLYYSEKKLRLNVEYINSPNITTDIVDLFRKWIVNKSPPSVIIIGSAIGPIKSSNGSIDALKEYNINITKLVQPIDKLKNLQSRILWTPEVPVNEQKLNERDFMITNNKIDLYNNEAIKILTHSAADIWWSSYLIGEGMITDSPDGIQLTSKSLKHSAQILLNMYCNDYMNFDDGTCCSSSEPYNVVQITTFFVLGSCLLIAAVMVITKKILEWRKKYNYEYTLLVDEENQKYDSSIDKYYNFFILLGRLTIIMTYFFICDRTNFFMKENKYYSEFSFWLPIGYITVLGLFFTEESKWTKVLHRNQLDETKGWMLLVILIYHITGADHILPINMHVKVLISGYLFLLGYEQFGYTWHRNDFSLVGFFRMMFQLNFMTVILCLCMNRPYQFYYFVPLLSFWYVMIYIFFVLPPHITANSSENNPIQYFYLLLKFLGFFSIITILYISEVFFEKIFVTRPWKALFVTSDDDIKEWWMRWKLDRYSVLYGMIFAVLLLLAQRFNLFDDNNHSNLFSRGVAVSSILLAILGLGGYVSMTFLCQDELQCREIHSYVVCVPIVGFILLRNISGILRTRYSSLFAWFGEISLELFVGQYHILLAADTHGVLVLLPGYPVLNMIITSFIYISASHEICLLTKKLLPYAVPADWKLVLRNFLLFLAILVPIGINDGMF